MSEHIVSKKLYYIVFGALMVLTWVTYGVSLIDMGPFNIVVALAIAVVKALLVILFFMHVKYSSRLTKLVVVSGFFWLALMIVFTLSDYFTRDWSGFHP